MFKLARNIGQSISDFVVRLILTLIYFALLSPVALWHKRQQKSVSRANQATMSFWSRREFDNPTFDDSQREY